MKPLKLKIEGINHTYSYSYDTKGNISSYSHYEDYVRKNYSSFSYNAKNELTKAVIDGQTYNITYSSTGQLNVYFDWNITYDMRSIKVIENDEYYIEYFYNANGVRISKEVTINGITTNIEYVLNGTNIIEEIRTIGTLFEVGNVAIQQKIMHNAESVMVSNVKPSNLIKASNFSYALM